MSRSARVAWAVLCAPCLLGSCRPHTDAALPSNTTRWVFSPSALASLSSDHDTLGAPAQIRLGDPFGRSALYLKFPNDWSERGRAVQAFVTLTPSEGATSDALPISVEAWRVKSDWQPEELHAWSDKPELAPPSASTTIRNAPARELRIDVTELVRFAIQNPERDFGLALLTRSGSGQGAVFATGMAGGNAPQLEIYASGAR
jgi:hypothetical protein